MTSQLSPLVTVPGTTATHVLGGSSVDLANGDLTLVSTPTIRSATSESEAPNKKPLLTLTVGKAAFPLYKDTVFGTVEGDERVYIFQPDLGEDVKGYVHSCRVIVQAPDKIVACACQAM